MWWAFLRSPARFLAGSSWKVRFGAAFIPGSFALFAVFGERPAHRLLRLLEKALALPRKLLGNLLGRVVETPREEGDEDTTRRTVVAEEGTGATSPVGGKNKD